jgi:two-component sensor histidine kinase
MLRPLFHALITLLILCFAACTQKGDNREATLSTSSKLDTATISQLLRKATSFKIELDSTDHYSFLAATASREMKYGQGLAKAMSIQSDVQRRKGNYAEAVSASLKCMNIADSLGMSQEQVDSRIMLADIYKQMGGDKNTVDYLEKALELSREGTAMAEGYKDSVNIVDGLNEQGIILRDLSKATPKKDYFDSAFFLYQKAIAMAEEMKNGRKVVGKLYNNISQVYNEYYKDYPKALEYLFKAVNINTENNSLNGLSYNFGNISDVYLRQNDYPKAKFYAQRMLEVGEKLKAPHRLVNAYNQLTKVSKQLKQYDSALHFKEEYIFLSDSLNNIEKSGQIAEMQTKYETEIKEAEITKLSQSNKIKTQRMILFGAAACILALVMGLLWVQKRKLQKQQVQIMEQSEKLKWLMKELHHRVKNNLQIVSSLLNLQTYRLKDEESVAALRESQLRVQAMSLIHQRLYQVDEVTLVNFKLYISDLTETLMKAYGYDADSFDLQVNVEKELLDVDTVMPLGLLVNEVITNSFKYAYKNVAHPALTVDLLEKNNQLQLTVKDNGPGMSTGDSKTGFGKQLINALTKQLKAKCEVNVIQGTSYLFTIPYTKEKAA